jgi:hypothetical protein
MSEVQAQPKNSKNMHAIILTILGAIVLILGVAIATIHGMPLRGSGAGTALSILGIALLIIAFLRFSSKRS